MLAGAAAVLITAATASALVLEAGNGGDDRPSDRRYVRPSGPGHVRFEDLYHRGDSVNDALGRLSSRSPNVSRDGTAYITFPEGRFEFSDFEVGGLYGIYVPRNCRGIWGSGPGTLNGSTGTVFAMRPRSWNGDSPASGSNLPNSHAMMYRGTGVGGGQPVSMGQFQLAGSDQGDSDRKCYHGLVLKNPESPVTVTDLLITGWFGNSGMPPGETFGLVVSGAHGPHRLVRIEADGRRSPSGPGYGSSGITLENTFGAYIESCRSHHTRSTSLVLYQAFDTVVNHFVHGPLDYARYVGTSQGINLERTAGTVMTDLAMYRSDFEALNPLYNITHSNDTYHTAIDGHVCSTVNGSLTIRGVKFQPLYSDGYFRVLTHHPYDFAPFSNGDTMTTPPRIQRADGAPLAYWWLHEGSAPRIVG